MSYKHLQSSIHSIYSNIDNANYVITFARDKCFWLVYTNQSRLEGENNSRRRGESLDVVIPTIKGISFRSLNNTLNTFSWLT
jgi:hypothetical protein